MGRFEIILLIIVAILVISMLLVMFIPFEINADEIHMEAMVEMGYDCYWDLFNADIDVELHFPLIWGFKLVGYGGFETFSSRETKLSFQPQLNVYDIGAGLRFYYLEVFIQHFCIHPGDYKKFILYGYSEMYLQSGTTIGVRFDTRYRLKDAK